MPYDDNNRHPARVTRVDRGELDALAAEGPLRAVIDRRLLQDARRDPMLLPCTGDWVVIETATERRTAVAVLTRRSAIVRATAAEGVALGQVLAANVDIAFVVEGLWPEPDLARIERLLALAWESGAMPVVVLTKADMVHDADEFRTDVTATAPGVDVHAISAVTGDGMAAIRPYAAPGRTIALLGPSGSGKSTLTNALMAEEVMTTRALRADHKGRHTTVHRELVSLPSGGMLIDTPGLRAVGLWNTEAALEHVFTDIDELARSCRFRDCTHVREPGCAVLAAVDDGRLAERRLLSWRKLQREAQWIAARSDARSRALRVAEWKRIEREIRRRKRIRP